MILLSLSVIVPLLFKTGKSLVEVKEANVVFQVWDLVKAEFRYHTGQLVSLTRASPGYPPAIRERGSSAS